MFTRIEIMLYICEYKFTIMVNEEEILLSYNDIVRKSGRKVPTKNLSGVYFLIDVDEIVYVGSCRYFRNRLRTHGKEEKKFDRWYFIEYSCERTMVIDESDFIWDMCPIYNRKDNPVWMDSNPHLYRNRKYYYSSRNLKK